MTSLEHRLRGVADALAAGHATSTIHALDPRAKIAVTAAFLAVTASYASGSPEDLAPLFFFPCIVGAQADIAGRDLLGRALLLSPLVLLVGAAEPFLHRTPVPLAPGIAVAAGWFSLAGIVEKFVLSVAGALLLARTTRMDDLCVGLVRLGMPRTLALQLLLLVRYLFVLGEEALRMLRAHGARTGGSRPRLALAGPLLGSLLLRTLARAERIHRAMEVRGFGTAALDRGHQRRLSRQEWTFLTGWITFFLLVRWMPLSTLLLVGGFR